MGIMKDTMGEYYSMVDLLINVVIELEDSGNVEVPTYLAIREQLKTDDPIPEVMQKRIDVWNELNE